MRFLFFAVLTSTFACSSTPQTHAEPPPSPDAGVVASTTATTFAIDSIVVDDATKTVWKTLGFDLDGKDTTLDSTDVCTLGAGAPHTTQVDGLDGRDNAFSVALVPMLVALSSPFCFNFGSSQCPPLPTLSSIENGNIQAGDYTVQFRVTGLTGSPTQDATGLSVDALTSDAFSASGAVPSFDTTTDWPVRAESLSDPSTIASNGVAHFSSAYVTHGTLVAGTNEDVTVAIFIRHEAPLTLLVHHAIITFNPSSLTGVTNGVIAGILDPIEVAASIRQIAHLISTSLCGSAFDGINQQIQQSADILLDGTNDSHVACNGTSVGIGFHAKRVANPTMVTPAASALPDPCDPPVSDAGTD